MKESYDHNWIIEKEKFDLSDLRYVGFVYTHQCTECEQTRESYFRTIEYSEPCPQNPLPVVLKTLKK